MSPRGTAHPFSIAPMMDRTDRHYRWMARRLTRRALLYTEMVTTGAVLHGDRDQLLGFDPSEHPLALQLGGDDPTALAKCARIAWDRGYDEVNLNVGCPSDRVRAGHFGACLMLRPEVVARCVEAMRAAVPLPVTVKHRIGVDDVDSYESMRRFVEVVAEAGADRFTVHARKAWLQGLSPKENRDIPPLRYGEVHRLKAELPHLTIEINGGLTHLSEYREQLRHVDAVMVGRAAYDNPWHLVEIDPALFAEPAPATSREDVAEALAEYVDRHVAEGGRAHHALRHFFNLYAGQPGARTWRRILTEEGRHPEATGDVVRRAQRERLEAG